MVKINDGVALFDIHGLLQILVGTSMEALRLKLESKYVLWMYISSESAFRKLNSIYCTMSWYATCPGSVMLVVLDRFLHRFVVKEKAAL